MEKKEPNLDDIIRETLKFAKSSKRKISEKGVDKIKSYFTVMWDHMKNIGWKTAYWIPMAVYTLPTATRKFFNFTNETYRQASAKNSSAPTISYDIGLVAGSYGLGDQLFFVRNSYELYSAKTRGSNGVQLQVLEDMMTTDTLFTENMVDNNEYYWMIPLATNAISLVYEVGRGIAKYRMSKQKSN